VTVSYFLNVRTLFIGYGDVGLMVGLDDLRGLFQAYNSMILSIRYDLQFYITNYCCAGLKLETEAVCLFK